jgi:anti-sigma regulatory factor (Ser/Thr protein kinase)
MSKELEIKEKVHKLNFKPRARLLLQLGDQLIKNEKIALIELVKNSYDADASKAEIYMENVESAEEGIIIIEDDGFGMDLDTVINVWMEPGSDFKTQKFEKRELTPRFNRLPIGEKGIGRFGAHKLGNIIEMTTKKNNHKEIFVKIDWTIFNHYRYLDQVPITIIERSVPKLFKNDRTGTNITISNLRKEWNRGIAREVKRSVTALASPFEIKSSFFTDFNVTDKPNWFDDLLLWSDIKDYSLYHFKVVLTGNSISTFEYDFTPWNTMPKLSGRTVKYSINKKSVGLISTEEKLIEYFKDLTDSDDNLLELSKHNIGEILFEGYIFDRDQFVLKLGVSDKKGFKGYLDSNCGIRVFRDGLRVYDYGEPENDWLGLDLRRVNQPTKKLSNNIVLGAVYLKRKESFDLVEKTNREGFVENKAYDVFKNSILHVIEIIETLRYNDKLKLREIYGPTPKSEPVIQLLGELKEYVDKNIKDSKTKNDLVKYIIKVEDDYKRINENLLKAAGAGLSLSVVIHEIEKIIIELQKVIKIEKGSERIVKLVKHLASLIDGYSEIVKRSTQTNVDLKDIIEQSLFNTEYRLITHKVEIVHAYKEFTGKTKTKIARNLLISSIMNIIDNSIYWLEKSGRLQKRIYINIFEDYDDFIDIIIADNGTGFLLPTDEITEPFVSAKPGGMGLGLHIASEIMSAQGGNLNFPDWGEFEIPKAFKEGAVINLRFKR